MAGDGGGDERKAAEVRGGGGALAVQKDRHGKGASASMCSIDSPFLAAVAG